MDGDVLALVARYPRLGAVKTRLGRAIGQGEAFALYSAFLRDLDARLAHPAWRTRWLYTPADAPFAAWLGARRAVAPQRGDSLNVRLLNGMRALLAEHRRAVIMSTDSPHVPLAWLEQAFAALTAHDVVLGPCDDGGYYLVGLRAPHDLFSGVVMSTPTVLADTLAQAQAQRLSVALLPTTFDVDDESGVRALRAHLAGCPADELPWTRAALRNIPLAGGAGSFEALAVAPAVAAAKEI